MANLTTQSGLLYGGFFQHNADRVRWIQTQSLAFLLVCLGDGHADIWNLFADIAPDDQRFEILDWYHLKENLFKVKVDRAPLEQAEADLWQGEIDAVRAVFAQAADKSGLNFCAYLHTHRYRLIDCQQVQADQLCSIGSGAVESAVK